MKNIIEQIDQVLSVFDYLFQEGVVFEQEEINQLKLILDQFNNIINDDFINIKKG